MPRAALLALLLAVGSGCRCQKTSVTSKLAPRAGPCDLPPAPATATSAAEAERLDGEAVAALRAGRRDDAVTPLAACVGLSPPRPSCFKRLGSALAKQEHVAEAYTCYRRFLEVADAADPDVPKVRALLDSYEHSETLVPTPEVVKTWKRRQRDELMNAALTLEPGDEVQLGPGDVVRLNPHGAVHFRIADPSIMSGYEPEPDGLYLSAERAGATTGVLELADGDTRVVRLLVVNTPDCVPESAVKAMDLKAPLPAPVFAHVHGCRACRRRVARGLLDRARALSADPLTARAVAHRVLELDLDGDQRARAKLLLDDFGD